MSIDYTLSSRKKFEAIKKAITDLCDALADRGLVSEPATHIKWKLEEEFALAEILDSFPEE